MPRYPGWNILVVCLVFQALIIGTVFFSYTLAVGEWLEDDNLNVTLTYVMAPITVLTLCQSIVSPVVGYALDRYSIRVMICFGVLLVYLIYIFTVRTFLYDFCKSLLVLECTYIYDLYP